MDATNGKHWLQEDWKNCTPEAKSWAEESIVPYLETALWASTDENGEPLMGTEAGKPTHFPYGPDDVSEESRLSSLVDLAFFYSYCKGICPGLIAILESDRYSAAHDFFLTRCRHGAGFWDGDYPGASGRKLTDAAHTFGNVNLYIGDDGKVWIS